MTKNKTNVVVAVKGKAGAPAKTVLTPSRGKFTVNGAYQYNVDKGNKVCKLTVRKFVESSAAGYRIVKKNGVAKKIKVEKILTLLDEVAKKDTAGRPNFLYTRVAGATSAPKATAKPVKLAVKTATVTPAVTVVPVATTVVPKVEGPVVTTDSKPVVASPASNTDPVAY